MDKNKTMFVFLFVFASVSGMIDTAAALGLAAQLSKAAQWSSVHWVIPKTVKMVPIDNGGFRSSNDCWSTAAHCSLRG